MTDVRPGQVWADKDRRMIDRRVTVGRVDAVYAYCRDAAGGRVRLLLRRMGKGSGSSGWRLVKDD